MAEQQLIDYIQKARQANQGDEQSRALLIKNGWTDAEVNDAILALPKTQSQPEPAEIKPQVQSQPQITSQPETKIETKVVSQPEHKPQTQQTQAKPQFQAKPAQTNFPKQRKNSHLLLNLFLVLIILAIIGGIGYFFLTQQSLVKSLLNNFSTTASSVKTSVTQKVNTVTNQNTATPTALSAAKLTSAPADFDASKITVAGFNKTGDKMAYCAQSKTTNKISCYLNDQILGNPYTFKPYWIGFSPDNQRVVFLYIDPSSKQYFTYENGVEGQRYDGPINAPKFSDDSKNFLYVVTGKDTKNFVVLNGTPYAAHDKIYGVPVFSSDGKYLLYGARDGQDFSWVADPIQ